MIKPRRNLGFSLKPPQIVASDKGMVADLRAVRKKVREGEYPAGIKISPRVTAWLLSDVEELFEKFSQKDAR